MLSSFSQAYGRELMEAQEWCNKYQRSGNVKDLTQAWDLYYHVFRRICKQLPQVNMQGSHMLPCCAVNLVEITESYIEMVVGGVKHCSKVMLLSAFKNKSCYFSAIIYLWLNSLQELLTAVCDIVMEEKFTTLTIVSNFSVMLPTTDESTVREMTGDVGLLYNHEVQSEIKRGETIVLI